MHAVLAEDADRVWVAGVAVKEGNLQREAAPLGLVPLPVCLSGVCYRLAIPLPRR